MFNLKLTQMAKSITIERVKVRKLSATKLELTLPDGMTGDKLSKWQRAHKAEAMAILEDSEPVTEEPVKYIQG